MKRSIVDEVRTRWSHLFTAAILMLVVGGCTGGGEAADDWEAVGEPETVTAEEFDEAVSSAMSMLIESPGFESLQRRTLDDEVDDWTWVDWRPSGDWVLVELEAAGSSDTDTTPAGDSDPVVYAMRDGTLFTVGGSISEWIVEREEPDVDPVESIPTFFPAAQIAEGGYFTAEGDFFADVIPPETSFTRQEANDGGSVWRLSSQTEEPSTLSSTMTWGVHPDGHLRSLHLEPDVPSTGPGLANPSTTEETFVVHNDPDPLPTPVEGEPLDIDSIGFPTDLPTDG